LRPSGPNVNALEAGYVAALLGLLSLGQARQQRFRGGNTFSVSGFPGIEIGGWFETALFFRGLLRLGPGSKHFFSPLAHSEVHCNADQPYVIGRISAARRFPIDARREEMFDKRFGKALLVELKPRNAAAPLLLRA
jgi:hypothetical protein